MRPIYGHGSCSWISGCSFISSLPCPPYGKHPAKTGLNLKYFADFTEQQIAQFTALDDLYTEWNAKINVISRKDIDSIYLHHVLHSLSIAAIADFQPGTQIIDIGCGGGFPVCRWRYFSRR
jgi:hypothetical protein